MAESILSQRLCEQTVLFSVPRDLEIFMAPPALHDVTLVGGWRFLTGSSGSSTLAMLVEEPAVTLELSLAACAAWHWPAEG